MVVMLYFGAQIARAMDYCILLACLVWVTSATIMGDECDWTGSGLSLSSTGRGVTPVYLRCTAGRISWLYPRGALRVLLRVPGQDRDFRACIKMHPDIGNKVPARLFLEGPRSLLPLYSSEDGGNKIMRCFNSKNGQVAIYVEATDGESVNKRVADFEYDLQPLPRGSHRFDPSEECRPCTKEEMAHAFCTSDLVTRGIIRGVENQEDLELSQMIVKVTKMIRQPTEDDDFTIETNSIERFGEEREIQLNVAQRCGVSHGVGEFVFMARRKLGELTLQCAPRLEDWALLMHSLTEEGKAHCVLSS
ncbi:PREDICTED: meteorin-like protein [Nicrophorus vespilloides]|uniref:Meteorin-like protein n=1 Tax=Nicrophorus vespilloides TaxID=110193 RepID=A0ABM1N6Z0_NICVS|nr:PREDICTED: meteorin-like protein [Nicrophorus vespilloides]